MTTITPLDQIKRFEITCVYDNPEATVDIVLVHGLNGHPRETWTSKNNGMFWPSGLLPQTLKGLKARVLVYGYNANVYTFGSDSSASSDMIHQHAQTLLTALSTERESEDMGTNAIIWVAHSLGGILVKRALLLSNDLTGKNAVASRSIFVATYGIIFLGTPHTGADGAKWGHILQKMLSAVTTKKMVDTEDQLLKTLKTNNETLQNINLHFLDIYQRFEIDMVHESVKTDLTGTKDFIVDQISASPQLPGVRYYGIEANHSGMCKFSSKNAPGYLNVSVQIKKWIKECEPKIHDRWDQEAQIRQKQKENEARELLGIFGGNLSPPVMTPQMNTGNNTPALANHISNVPNTTIIQAVASIAPDAVIETLAPTSHFIKPHGFRPNSLFVGREEELGKLHKRLFDKKRRSEGVAAVLLQSIPGGGKTHLARQYVYKHLRHFPGGVFWVTAKSMEQLKAGFWRIAETVALKPSQIAKLPRNPDNFVASVIDWFTSHHEWLLVLDGIHFDHDSELQSFIPDSKNSSLLYTSTEDNVGGDHHFMNPYVMQLPLLSAREAQQLFLLELGNKNPSTDELSEAMKLVQRMGFLPEVIHVAAKRLKGTREPLAKFAKAYNQGPKLRAMDTFVAVRNQLIKEESMAPINLMQIICYFSGNIPVEMISLGLKAVDLPLKAKEPATGCSLNNTFKTLNRYALIQRNEPEMRTAISSRSSKSSQTSLLADDLDVIRVHKVIQDFFIDSIRAADITPKWLGHAIAVFTLSYHRAWQLMAEAGSDGLVSDFRSYEIQGRRLLGHLNKLEKKGPVIPPSRQVLEAALTDVERRIRERTHQSSIDISTGHCEGFLSVFDRTSSSSDTGPETPGINGTSNAAGYVLWDTKQRESPISIEEQYAKAVFPEMGELEHYFDNDVGYDSERESEVELKGSHHTLAPYSTSPSLNGSSLTDNASEKGKWTTVDYQRRKIKAHIIDHRTTRHLEQNRYHDRAGAFRAMLPHAPAKVNGVRPCPDTAVSQETVQGFIPHVFQPISDTGWLPFPIFSPHSGRPLSSGKSDTSGGSAAEVALGKISKASPPPGRGGGNIQVRGANSPRPGQGHFRRDSDQLLGGLGHSRTGTFSDAHIQETPLTATTIPIGSSQLAQMASDHEPPEAQKAGRQRLATLNTSAAHESLQRIPYYHPAQEPEFGLSRTEVNKPLVPRPPLSRPPPPHPTELASSEPADTAGFYQQPYPVSDLDLSQSLTASSLFSLTPPVQQNAPLYPRRTGPLPIDVYPGVRAIMTAPSSDNITILYPHDPYPYARSTPARPHHHTTGYSSQPMSRDTSEQSKTSGSSDRTRNSNSLRTTAGMLTDSNAAPPSYVGMSPAYGNVDRGNGIEFNILDGRPRSHAVSFTESEPGSSLPKIGSPMGSGRTSYRAYMDEAAHHVGNPNRRAFAKNQILSSIPQGGRGSQAGFSALVDRGLHHAMHQDDVALQAGEGAIFEPRIPRRPKPGTMSVPQTTSTHQREWALRSRSATIGGKENVRATNL